MPQVPHTVVQRIKEKYPKPSLDPAWLQPCYDWIVEERGYAPSEVDKLFIEVENQYLGSDLKDSTMEGTGLPPNIDKMQKGRIATRNTGGSILCQIVDITEIGHSAFSLRNVRQTRIDKADMAGLAAEEEGDENGQPPQNGEDYSIPPYPRATLRLTLSDGFRIVHGFEYRPLPMIKLGETPLGAKVLLSNVLIQKGRALLAPDNITFSPNSIVEELDEQRDVKFSRGLRVRLGLPEIDPEEEDLQRKQQADDTLRPAATMVVDNAPIRELVRASAVPVEPVRAQPSVSQPTVRALADSNRTASSSQSSPSKANRSEAAKADRIKRLQQAMEAKSTTTGNSQPERGIPKPPDTSSPHKPELKVVRTETEAVRQSESMDLDPTDFDFGAFDDLADVQPPQQPNKQRPQTLSRFPTLSNSQEGVPSISSYFTSSSLAGGSSAVASTAPSQTRPGSHSPLKKSSGQADGGLSRVNSRSPVKSQHEVVELVDSSDDDNNLASSHHTRRSKSTSVVRQAPFQRSQPHSQPRGRTVEDDVIDLSD